MRGAADGCVPAQVVGTHFQSVPEPGLFMCMRCHYIETSTGKLTPSVHPFKAMEPATHHHLAAWDEASDMLSTQGSLSGSLNEEDYLYMGHQPEQDLSGLPDDPSSQVRSRAQVNAACSQRQWRRRLCASPVSLAALAPSSQSRSHLGWMTCPPQALQCFLLDLYVCRLHTASPGSYCILYSGPA